jgi:hypothetical protein
MGYSMRLEQRVIRRFHIIEFPDTATARMISDYLSKVPADATLCDHIMDSDGWIRLEFAGETVDDPSAK